MYDMVKGIVEIATLVIVVLGIAEMVRQKKDHKDDHKDNH